MNSPLAFDVFEHKGRRLEYETAGEGRPIVFLHGLGGSILQMRSSFDLPEGFRRISLNQQGHGGSDFDPAAFTFDSLGDDAAALLDHLGIRKAFFAGISMGAAVALNAAVRYPEKVEGLFLVRNAWTDQPMQKAVITAYKDLGLALKRNDPEAFRDSEGGRIVEKTGSDYTRGAFSTPFHEEPQLRNWEKYLLLPPQAPVRSIREIEKLRMPVTILACRGDFCHPYEMGVYLRDHIKDAVLYEIPNKDENPEEHRRLSNRYFREFG